jgi:hypothetical protein
MASKKISELPSAGALTGSELVESVQGGINVKTTAQQIADLGGGGGGTWGSITGTLSDQTDLQSALDAKQATLTAANFGDFMIALTAKSVPVDADSITISDSAASADAKEVTLTEFKAFLKTYFDTLYSGISQTTTSTAGATITLDMNSAVQRSHVGSATFNTAKAVAMSNTTGSLFFNFIFEVTSVSAVLTFPADWLSSSLDFNGATWTPPNTGKFEFGGSFDDVNNVWYVKVSGPFQ